jgi:hypothetical protein
MLSLCDDEGDSSGFGEALAKVLAFCFQDMQHVRFSHDLRAACASAGLDVGFDIDVPDN